MATRIHVTRIQDMLVKKKQQQRRVWTEDLNHNVTALTLLTLMLHCCRAYHHPPSIAAGVIQPGRHGATTICWLEMLNPPLTTGRFLCLRINTRMQINASSQRRRPKKRVHTCARMRKTPRWLHTLTPAGVDPLKDPAFSLYTHTHTPLVMKCLPCVI